jgi:tetratricopeptide (TPR) repeat protein
VTRRESIATAIDSLERILGPRPWLPTAASGETYWAAFVNRAGALCQLAQISPPKEARSLFEEAIGSLEYAAGVLASKGRDDLLRYAEANLGFAYQQLGMSLENAESLRKAVETHRAALALDSRERNADLWANSQNNLGNSLSALAQRLRGDDSTKALLEALECYESAATTWVRRRFPGEWLMVHSNIANRKLDLAERITGSGQRALVDEAVTISAELVKHTDRASQPSEWARLYNNLGSAFRIYANLQGAPEALGSLKRAEEAHLNAISISQDVQGPVRWAEAQMNLGNVLVQLGEQVPQEFESYMDRAAEAYRCAREVGTLFDSRKRWGSMLINTANGLGERGRRTSGDNGLRLLLAAVTMYEQVLDELDQSHFPRQWAKAQSSLASALGDLGLRTNDSRMLGRAVAAARSALQVFTLEDDPLEWGHAQTNLGNALTAVAKALDPSSAASMFLQALEAFDGALQVFARRDFQREWATITFNKGALLATMGERDMQATALELLRDAIELFRQVATVWTRDMPMQWADNQMNLATASIVLASRVGGRERATCLENGSASLDAASKVFSGEAWVMQQARISRLRERLDKLKAQS